MLRILVAGWLLGGAALVALTPWTAAGSAARTPPARQRETVHVSAGGLTPAGEQASTTSPSFLVVPVLGVQPSELRDDFAHPRGNGRTHGAIDILASRGTPVVAAVDGTIRKLFTSRTGGLTIYQFDRGENRVYYYAHLDSYARGLAEGLVVRQGTVIGYVGTTGNAPADTPHLHFSVENLPPAKEWWKGSPVNPYPLLAGPSAVR